MGSTDRILEIIETVVAHQPTGVTHGDVVARTGMPKTSVHRILKDLTRLGYVWLNPETRKYRGTLKLASLGSMVVSNLDLRDYVHPRLLRLHQATDHICHAGIRDGRLGVYLDKIESRDYGIKLFSEVGKIFPLHGTSLGKVLLAFAEPADIEDYLTGSLEHLTEKTVVDPARLREELAAIRAQGYAVDHEESTRGLMCVGAPVYGTGGEVICAISVTFPTYIFTERGIRPEIEAVLEHATALSAPGKR